MRRWKIILPSLIATTSLPFISLVGCGEKTTIELSGGNTKLWGEVGEQGSDTNSWSLKKGTEILEATLEVVGPDKDKVGITDGFITWNKNLEKRNYVFKIQTTYDGKIYQSNDITLRVGPTATSFESDSWDTVVWWANQGIDVLHHVYKNECDNNPIEAFKGSLVGYQRNLSLKFDENTTQTYPVKVIGEEQDNYGVDQQELAALTFEFVNVISDADEAPLTTYRTLEVDGEFDMWHYWDCNVDACLNTQRPGEEPIPFWCDYPEMTKSVLQMIDDGGDLDLTDIKSVNRKANESDDDGQTYQTIKTHRKLFLPNISDMYTEKGISQATRFNEDDLKFLMDENSRDRKQYTYYKEFIGDGSIDGKFNELKKTSLSNQCADFYISSRCLNWGNFVYVASDYTFIITNSIYSYFNKYAVAPCFCI